MAKKAAEKIEFKYEGTNRAGAKVKGEIFALSDVLVKAALRKQGSFPLGTHDDGPDALEMVARVALDPGAGVTVEQM